MLNECPHVSRGINPSTYITEPARSLSPGYELPIACVYQEPLSSQRPVCREYDLRFRWIIGVNRKGVHPSECCVAPHKQTSEPQVKSHILSPVVPRIANRALIETDPRLSFPRWGYHLSCNFGLGAPLEAPSSSGHSCSGDAAAKPLQSRNWPCSQPKREYRRQSLKGL